MAAYYGLGADEPSESSERKVAAALKTLPDSWIVFHSVSWQSKRSGRQGDGEADFLVVHPRKGMLVIEVKGGGIEIDRGRWTTTDRRGDKHEIKNPFDQATASKHALLGWLRSHGLMDRLRVGHGVVFPDMRSLPIVGPAAQPAISLIKSDLDAPLEAITKCMEHWELEANLSLKEINKLVSLLAPTVDVRPDLSSASADAEAELLVLTAEQIDAFAGLRANRGGLIVGGAGTGKTVLAIARAQQLARDGFRTLLVCYNELLGESLTARLQDTPTLSAGTFHSLCLREASRAGIRTPPARPTSWWEFDAPNLLIEACAVNETAYDAIVVDEGQDFSPLWLDALRCLISSDADAPFFVFADPLQDIWGRDWSAGAGQPFSWELTRNLRNTRPIAKCVADAVGVTCKDRGVSGPPAVWRTTTETPREKDVLAAVETLIGEGFGPTNLVVLCGSPALASRLRERSVGPFSFGRWGSRGIPVESIARFKGLEAQAVIVALDTGAPEGIWTEAYVGLSRARSILVVIGTIQHQASLNWGVPAVMSK